MNSKAQKLSRKKKAPLKPPRLRKLGTLGKLTRGTAGQSHDGASGMTRP